MSASKEQLKNLVEKSRDNVKRYDGAKGTIDFGNMTGNDVFNTRIGDDVEQKLPWSTDGYDELKAAMSEGNIEGGHVGKYPSAVENNGFWTSLNNRVNRNTGSTD